MVKLKLDINKLKNHDRSEFNKLIINYREPVFNIINRLINNETAAEDLVQETFLKVYLKINKLRKDKSLKSWIYRIAVNISYDYIRKQKLFSFFSIDKVVDLLKIEPESEKQFEKHEDISIINSAISKLPPKHRSVIVLKEIENLSYLEISKILKCSIGTVESRLFRARKKLQIILKKME